MPATNTLIFQSTLPHDIHYKSEGRRAMPATTTLLLKSALPRDVIHQQALHLAMPEKTIRSLQMFQLHS